MTSALRWVERLLWTIGLAACTSSLLASSGGSMRARQEVRNFEQSTPAAAPAAALAVLRIPRIGLEVPVLEGTGAATLRRGVGHIENTALPGTGGNIGIAAHRDSFFRGLKDVRVGDLLEIETHAGRDRYRIARTWIVEPDDVSVLDPTASPSITLVTCYPFYFVGAAPQRFIVRAERTHARPRTNVPG